MSKDGLLSRSQIDLWDLGYSLRDELEEEANKKP